MDKHFDPQAIEAKWYEFWEKTGQFNGDVTAPGDPYCIVIPPPNVTGILHMGHALNNTVQDVLVRWRRMQGRNVLWVPGTDHAGIATQNVVEKALRKEGKSRRDLGREAFVERVWEWRAKYGGTIVNQLRRLGCSCDWTRERFTMDEGLSRAVAEVFCRLYEEDLVYRGNYIVNWCPRCGTALADDESEHETNEGSLWHVRYPVAGRPDKFVEVATTRPETLPGDTAVAVNPKDERYTHLHGAKVTLPLSNREIPVVVDDYVEREFGTGVVKITPAHDPNDFLVAQRHNLPALNIMNGDGTMNEHSGYEGLDRFECRKQIVKDLDAGGYLVKVEPYTNAVGHCYRCSTVVEPRLSKQWFVRMKPLAQPAMEAVRSGRVKFTPQRYENTFFTWMENIRDWCISRQIWWGHRIPVYTCECGHEWAAPAKPVKCPKCQAGAEKITQETDVLDTWFSSWLWPFSTLGWPDLDRADLKKYYPTSDLVTAPDIIFFWVARMIMAGCKFMNEQPFSNVVIHGVVRDDQGRKMSKSLGNSIDPLDIIGKYSADSLRFSLMQITAPGVDLYVNTDKFEIGRNFGTKIWNAARFMSMHAEKTPDIDWRDIATSGIKLDPALLKDDDRHLFATCSRTIEAVTDALEKYRFQDAALAVYDFVRSSFCDWYLEYAKTDLYGDDEARHNQTMLILADVFSKAIRLLHPFMPFITEEIYTYFSPDKKPLIIAQWPKYDKTKNFEKEQYEVAEIIDAIRGIRNARAKMNIPPSKKAPVYIEPKENCEGIYLGNEMIFIKLASCDKVYITQQSKDEENSLTVVTNTARFTVPLDSLIDKQKETERLTKEADKLNAEIKRLNDKLSNESFVAKAPANVVETEREKLKKATELLAEVTESLNSVNQ